MLSIDTRRITQIEWLRVISFFPFFFRTVEGLLVNIPRHDLKAQRTYI